MKEIIMSFYQLDILLSSCFPPNCDNEDLQWYYLLQTTKCKNFLGLDSHVSDLYHLKVPAEGFGLLLDVANHYDINKDTKLLWLIKNNLP